VKALSFAQPWAGARVPRARPWALWQPCLLSLLLLMWLLLPAPSASAQPAEKRVALVIGNSSYADKPLTNPANDAEDLAKALRRLGFDVMERRNRNPDQMRRDLIEFQDKLSTGAVGLFYFAGHGVQAGRGLNYLLPVGVEYRRERDAEVFGLEAGSVLRRMEESGARLSLLILDACRDSPLPPEGRSSGSRGLGRMTAPSGSLIAFATAPGETADENRGARNGLYTTHLLAAIETPGLRIEDVFKQVRRDVERASNRRQSPEEISKLTSDFYFANPFAPVRPDNRERIEAEAWALCRGAATVVPCEDYLSGWPQGQFVALARTKLRDMAKPAPGPEPVRPGPVVAGNFKDCADCPEMVVIPAGSFLMGSPPSELGRSSDEGPQRQVRVQSFALGKTEVTVAQYLACVQAGGCTAPEWQERGSKYHHQTGTDDHYRKLGDALVAGGHPVVGVSHEDSVRYARWLSQKTGQRYKLPSEAEWEYAARAGGSARWGGQLNDENQLGQHAWLPANSNGRTQAVAGKLANPVGLFDMVGNVREWVQDCYDEKAYSGKAPNDGGAYEVAGCSALVLRGGSWGVNPQLSRAAYRNWSAPDDRYYVIGFRLARMLP